MIPALWIQFLRIVLLVAEYFSPGNTRSCWPFRFPSISRACPEIGKYSELPVFFCLNINNEMPGRSVSSTSAQVNFSMSDHLKPVRHEKREASLKDGCIGQGV